MIKFLLILLMIIFIVFFTIRLDANKNNSENKITLNGSYLDQKPPGNIPVKFAPGIVSSRVDETSIFFSPDGREIYFTRSHIKLMVIKKDKISNSWGKPHEVSFAGKYYQIGEANISPDGRKLYFNCRRAVPGAKTALTLWAAERSGAGWGTARGMKPPVNNQVMHAAAIAPDGSIYASGLRMSKRRNNRFENPVKLKIKGSHPYISTDGKYMIIAAKQPKGYGSDLFVMIRKPNSEWGKPQNLGHQINTESGETNAAVSPDGKYLFFQRKGDIYWVNAGFLLNLKKNKEIR